MISLFTLSLWLAILKRHSQARTSFLACLCLGFQQPRYGDAGNMYAAQGSGGKAGAKYFKLLLLISRNITRNKMTDAMRYSDLRGPGGRFRNPYDHGIKKDYSNFLINGYNKDVECDKKSGHRYPRIDYTVENTKFHKYSVL
ncbi:hypothetical protein RJT34_12527 [Clitoria ternatea]|uniref:Uncharacterized protein n=1 Tax=Clitoria ternatea TaxID=43366 RepID=A0AAN9JPV7_CLITE